MFRKKIDVKACTLLKTSEKKKFRALVSSTFGLQQLTDASSESGEVDGSTSSQFWSALVKGELAVTKAITDGGNKQFEFYALDKTPILFNIDRFLCPTVYLLWMIPNLLPRIVTHEPVFEKLKAGADLMLPGVITTTEAVPFDLFTFPSNTLCSVCLIGNDAPVAVGRALMAGAEMLATEPKKGKAVHILHVYQDTLWEAGPKTRVPSITLTAASQQRTEEEADPSRETLSGVASPAATGANDLDSSESAQLDNDTKFLLFFLYAVQKRLRRDDDLPVLASTFYGTVLLPLMPADSKIAVQSTTHKKFGVFLHRLQADGVITLEEPKKGVENISKINREHEIFKRYSMELKSLRTADQIDDHTNESPSKVDDRPVNMRELRAITATVLPVFQQVNTSFKKGQALGAVDVRSVITGYVKAKQLANGSLVKMDCVLSKVVAPSAVKRNDTGDWVTWEALMETVFDKMTPCMEIEYADRAKEVKKGKQPPIKIRVARRAGNKKVTMIDNVQAFGIDPKTLAHELQVTLAVSATLNEVPAVIGPQVQVQGDQSTALQKMFTEKYQIAKKYLQVG